MAKQINGFTLIELMIYLAISASIMVLLNNFVAPFYLKLAGIMKKNRANSQLWIAQDIFIRDLRAAPHMLQNWKRTYPDFLIWCSDDGEDIGWCIEDRKWYRITGIYDPTTQSWSKKMKSLTATNISEFSCSMQITGSSVVSARICLTSEQIDLSQEFNFYVALHNRDI